MQDFRVALVQCSPKVDGSPELNLDLFEKSLKETTENGSQFTMPFPGYNLTKLIIGGLYNKTVYVTVNHVRNGKVLKVRMPLSAARITPQ